MLGCHGMLRIVAAFAAAMPRRAVIEFHAALFTLPARCCFAESARASAERLRLGFGSDARH